MRGALVLLAALTLGTVPLDAGATTTPTLTLTQQARKADVIVRATLGTPTNVTEGGAIWVTYPLTVTEAVAGDPASLPQREGRPVLYVLSGLEDLPELRAGQEAFLLLYSRRMDNPIVGFAQGLYPVVNGRVTRSGEAGTGSTASGTATPAAPGATTPPNSAPSTTASGAGASGATAGAPPASGSGAATTTVPGPSAPATTPAPGTTTPSAASGSGSAPAPGSAAATPTTATGATAPTSAAGAGTASPNPAPGSTPAAAPTPGNATPPTPTPPAANAPAAFPSDPAAFRDALRAARETR